MQSCNTLFFTATFSEAKPLLNSRIFQKMRRNFFYAPSLDCYLVITGIGPKNTAKALASFCMRPLRMVNFGFCAGIKGVQLGQIVSPDKIAPWPLPVNLDSEPRALLLSLKEPMEDPAIFLNSHVLPISAAVIIADMEALTLFDHASSLCVPFECYKIVSDFGAASFPDSIHQHHAFLFSQLTLVATQQHFFVAK